jgi:hypothetical protein
MCCSLPLTIPPHVQGRSIRELLVDPKAPWEHPALTTFGFQNHCISHVGWAKLAQVIGGPSQAA